MDNFVDILDRYVFYIQINKNRPDQISIHFIILILIFCDDIIIILLSKLLFTAVFAVILSRGKIF